MLVLGLVPATKPMNQLQVTTFPSKAEMEKALGIQRTSLNIATTRL
jgi:hypothetical protein